MRVCFVDFVFDRTAPVGTDGLSEVVWGLAQPLGELGVEVHTVGPYPAGPYPSAKVHVHSFPVPPIGYRNIVGHILIVGRAIATLRHLGPFDVIHAPDYLSTAMLCLLGPGAPVVLTEPGNIFDRIKNGNAYDRVTTEVLKLSARISARRCARIMATSEEMAYWWKFSGASEAQIARIPLGIQTQYFSPVPDARVRLGWEAGRPHLLFTARLSPETGPATLIDAMPLVLRERPDALLHFVGAGKFEDELRERARALGVDHAIVWHGWVKLHDLASYFSAADLMVFPGTSGGTPRVMLQAMICGTPFVGSAIGGIVDHVRHGESGLLVPARDVAGFAAAVLDVLRDRGAARERAERARHHVLGLGWADVARRVRDEIYQPVIEERRVQLRPRHVSRTTS